MDPYLQFVRLLYEACHASEAEDRFDLHSESVASVAAHRLIEGAQNAAFRALIAHVRDHADEIMARIGEQPTIADEATVAKALRRADQSTEPTIMPIGGRSRSGS